MKVCLNKNRPGFVKYAWGNNLATYTTKAKKMLYKLVFMDHDFWIFMLPVSAKILNGPGACFYFIQARAGFSLHIHLLFVYGS